MLIIFAAAAISTSFAAATPELSIQEISHAFGYHISKNIIHPEMVKLDTEAVIQGIRDQAAGKPTAISEEHYEKALAALHEEAYARLSEKNRSNAVAFLTKNAAAKGVSSLQEGQLQFSIEKAGVGSVVEEHATPLIRYTGKYLSGQVFNTSEESPVPLNLDETFPSLSKAVVGMKEGERRTIFLHPDLAPGIADESSPSSLVIFEVEVVKANAPAEVELLENKAGLDAELEKALAIQ